jgi:hypothetical protein
MIIKNYIKSERNSSQKANEGAGSVKCFKMPVKSKNVSIDIPLMLSKNPVFQIKTSITPTANLIPMKSNIIKAYEDALKTSELKVEKPQLVVVLEEALNPQVPYDYLNEIYKSLLKEESEEDKVLDYLTIQYELNEKMRGILIDWLAEVHNRFQLQEETLFLTVRLIDIYLSKVIISRSKLQLLGVACLQIASKFEEILVPCIQDLVFVTDNAYSQEDVFKMEVVVLKQLEFNLVHPSSLRFYELIAQGFKFPLKHLNFGKYLLVLALMNFKVSLYPPSVVACSIAYIVMKYFKYSNYTDIYEGWNDNSNYNILKECAREMCMMVDNLDKYYVKATMKKFSSSKYDQVALISFG